MMLLLMIPKEIANYCSTFYRNLYESQYNKTDTDNFFAHLTETKLISDDQKIICGSPLTPGEVLLAIKHLDSINLPEVTACHLNSPWLLWSSWPPSSMVCL